jgi:PAS domain S-box-containing protein
MQQSLSERKKFEEKQLLHTSIINSSDDAIISKDLQGNITSWNKGAEKVFGYAASEIVGSHISLLIPGHLLPEETTILAKIKRGEVVDHYETERIRKDGRLIHVSITVSPVKDSAGNIVGASKVARDVTQAKMAEAEIKALNENLEKKIAERTEQLQAANKELESFSYSVAHDLRSPLRAVHGYTTMLNEDYGNLLDAEGNRLLNELANNAQKMAALIDDLLAFSKLGRKEMKARQINMDDLVNTCLNEINTAQPNKANIITGALLPVFGDASLMKHVLVNLISNAVKYSSKAEKPVIEIMSADQNDAITYYVKDNGVGFDMAFAGKLFGVFQRLHAEEDFEGTGVGLAIAQRIIYRHGGKIWAESKESEGATFFFSLPKLKTTKT